MMKPIHKFNGGNGATLCHRCNFKWMTTQVTEILESTATYIKFKTKNSEYELYIIEHDSKTTN
jgi:hypothetical protein